MSLLRASIILPVALAVSASCFAKTKPAVPVTLGELAANPQSYEGKQIALRCILRSADMASVYCAEGTQSVALSARTMDKKGLDFALSNCAKPHDADNSPKCQSVDVTATLKDAKRPTWLDNAKFKIK